VSQPTSFPDAGKTLTGTVWVCPCCGNEYRRRVVSVDAVNEARRQRDAMAALIREVSDEVVLLPVATVNAIAERAERAERELARLTP
jgi:hypothetical protein